MLHEVFRNRLSSFKMKSGRFHELICIFCLDIHQMFYKVLEFRPIGTIYQKFELFEMLIHIFHKHLHTLLCEII